MTFLAVCSPPTNSNTLTSYELYSNNKARNESVTISAIRSEYILCRNILLYGCLEEEEEEEEKEEPKGAKGANNAKRTKGAKNPKRMKGAKNPTSKKGGKGRGTKAR
mmetsp:Transcript_26908/g.39352  ORF Transcript_26908/g.39352 Transcript_26908/m.39352 type:complete len:107 (-) Transcript_26908:222-542(-)